MTSFKWIHNISHRKSIKKTGVYPKKNGKSTKINTSSVISELGLGELGIFD